MIIGIAGQALSGKDTLACAIAMGLQDRTSPELTVPIMHFADALRDVVEAIFGCRYETQAEKAAIDTWWQERVRVQRIERGAATDRVLEGMLGDKDLTGRWILQCLGMIGRHELHPDIWLLTLERRISKSSAKHHIISDVRFDNEAEWVRKQGGFVVQIRRVGQDDPAPDAHASEKGVRADLVTSYMNSPSVTCTQDWGRIIAQRVLEERMDVHGVRGPFFAGTEPQ